MERILTLLFIFLQASSFAQPSDSLRSSSRGKFVMEVQAGGIYHTFQNPVNNNSSLADFYESSRFNIAYGGEVGFLVSDALQFGLAVNYVNAANSAKNVSKPDQGSNSGTGTITNSWQYIDFSLAANYVFTLSEAIQLGPYGNIGILSFSNQISYFGDGYSAEGNGYSARVGAKLNFCLDEVVWIYFKGGYQMANLNQVETIRETFSESTQPTIITDLNGLRLQIGVHFNFLKSRKNQPINNF